MKKSIHQVAFEVIKESGRPMTAAEICQAMIDRDLYEFKAKNPGSVVRSQLRRHSVNIDSKNLSGEKLFKLVNDRFDIA